MDKPGGESHDPNKPENEAAWRGLSFAEICEREIPETKWLVPELLPEGSTLLAGTIKAGKSALLEWHACQVARDQNVVYFAFEYGELMLLQRVQKLQQIGASPTHISFWHKRDPVDAGMEPLRFVEMKIAETKPYLAVVDTLATIKPTTKGDYQSEYLAASMVSEIAHRENVNLLVAHHTRKKGKDSTDENPVEQLMGSQGIGATFDNVLIYDRPDGLTRLRGYGRMIEDFEIFLNYDSGRFSVTDKEQIAKEILQGQFPTGHAVAFLLMDGPRSINEIAASVNVGITPKDDTYLTKHHIYSILDSFRNNGLAKAPKQKGGLWEWTGVTG